MKKPPTFRNIALLLALAAGATQAHAAEKALKYKGDAVAQTMHGKMLEPTFLSISGRKVTAWIYSNAMGRPVAAQATTNAHGRFRTKVATASGVTGSLKGQVRRSGVVASGQLRKATRGLATLELRAGRLPSAPAPNGLPDLSGTRRLYLVANRIADSYESINFTMVKGEKDYSYRAVFADGPGRTDRVDARVDFPTGDVLTWTNDFTYTVLPPFWAKITFTVDIRTRQYRPGMVNFSFVLTMETFAEPPVFSGSYEGYFSIP